MKLYFISLNKKQRNKLREEGGSQYYLHNKMVRALVSRVVPGVAVFIR